MTASAEAGAAVTVVLVAAATAMNQGASLPDTEPPLQCLMSLDKAFLGATGRRLDHSVTTPPPIMTSDTRVTPGGLGPSSPTGRNLRLSARLPGETNISTLMYPRAVHRL